jgi:hypothetical protein
MLKLVLAQGYSFNTHNYNRVHLFKIYDEGEMPFDASGYDAPIVEIFDDLTALVIPPITAIWTTQASGIGSFSFSPTNFLVRGGPHYIRVKLVKAGTVVSTERRRIMVFRAPP